MCTCSVQLWSTDVLKALKLSSVRNGITQFQLPPTRFIPGRAEQELEHYVGCMFEYLSFQFPAVISEVITGLVSVHNLRVHLYKYTCTSTPVLVHLYSCTWNVCFIWTYGFTDVLTNCLSLVF